MPTTIRFGSYEVEPRSGELRKEGTKVRLREQCFEVLALLLERPGEVVTREELRNRLWPEDVYVDFDNGLNTAVARIREALGDSAERPRFIETLPRRGYRFIAPVDRVPSAMRPGPARKLRLAVLPLANLSGDPEQEYFSDGMTEELITQLAGIAPDRLGVIARTTAMQYKGTRKDVARIGRELDLDYAVEGTVRRDGDRVRISVQLIQVGDQTQLWAESYDREAREVIRLQTEVAQAIARRTEVAVSPAAQRRMERARPIDPEAHDAYVRGLHQYNKTDVGGFRNALEHFRVAVEKDPHHAPAWAKTAMTHAFSGLWGYASGSEAFPQAEAAATRALQLDEDLAEAHMARGTVAWLYRWDFTACRCEYERAVELNPNDPTGHWGLAMFLGSMKQDEHGAAVEIGLAQELDPLSSMIRSNAGWVHYWAGRYDRAVAQSREVLELDASCLQAYYVLGLAACARRSYEEAAAALEMAVARFGDPVSRGWLGMVYGLAGRRESARALLRELEQEGVSRRLPSCLAWVHAALGQEGEALDWLERAYQQHDAQVLWLRVSRVYDPLRAAPRFRRLVDRLNLPPQAHRAGRAPLPT